jgi:hypothetical protein
MATTARHLAWVFPALLGISAGVVPSVRASEPPAQPAQADPANPRSRESEVLNQLVPYIKGNDPLMNQTSSVSQLSDVKPTDWAFQALQSLVERYGCIVGYPDKTFRGNRALTRYEFAAGLNACIDRVNELIASATTDLAKKEDVETVQRLQEEFAAELAGIRGRLDTLETRTATLEKQQFTTTTKLQGEVILGLGGVIGNEQALNSDAWRTINTTSALLRGDTRDALLTNRSFVFPDGRIGGTTTARVGTAGTGANAGATAQPTRNRDVRENTIFADRIRLNLVTSFTGKDRLLTRLEANNTVAFSGNITGTNQTRLGWDGDTANAVQLGKANYTFPVGDKLNVTVDAIGGEFFSNFNTFSPYFENPASGSVSRFSRFSPIYRASNTGSGSNTGAGVSANLKLGKAFTLSAGYLARRAFDPNDKRGLFNGTNAVLAQLAFQPNKDLSIGLTYANAYYSGAENDVAVSGAYGTAFANSPFGAGVGNTGSTPRGVPTTANNFGIQASYRITPGFAISGWGLYTQAIAEETVGANVNRGDQADIWSWSIGLAFPDLFKKGNLAGIVFGQAPRVTGSSFGPAVATAATPRRRDDTASYQLEAFYRFRVSENISITPGLFAVFNPEGNSNNDDILVGVIRTTFRF